MEIDELLCLVTQTLDELGIEYRVVGSFACTTLGVPRYTNDIDIVVRMSMSHVQPFVARFSAPEFYCSEIAVNQAVSRAFQFNVIHPTSGFKVDFMVADSSDFNRSRFSRGRRYIIGENQEAWFASPEDVILKKLASFQEGKSEKHLRDITGIIKVQEHLDSSYLESWIGRMGLEPSWSLVKSRLS